MSNPTPNYDASVYGLDDPYADDVELDLNDDNDEIIHVLRTTVDTPVQRDIPVKDIVSQATDHELGCADVDREIAMQRDIKKDLTCQVCVNIMYKPATLMCQHTFCTSCLRDMENKVCPMCRSPFVVPGEYNRVLDNVVSRCFPREYIKVKTEEENLEFAKGARVRIEEELHRQIFDQVSRSVGTELRQRATTQATVTAPVAVPVHTVDPNVVMRAQLPEYVGDFVCNPLAVATTIHRIAIFNTCAFGLRFAALLLMWSLSSGFTRSAGVVFTVMLIIDALAIAANLGLTYIFAFIKRITYNVFNRYINHGPMHVANNTLPPFYTNNRTMMPTRPVGGHAGPPLH